MAISPEMNQRIEREMAALSAQALLRPPYSLDGFQKEFSRILGQAMADADLLTTAGYAYETAMPYCEALLEKLTLERAGRTNAASARSVAAAAFSSEMPAAEDVRKVLMAAGRFVVARSDKPEVKRVFDAVRKGDSQVDTLNDIVTMVGFVRAHRTLANQVRPGGIALDDPFLDNAEAEALRLLKLRGEAVTAENDEEVKVDRQKRLVTLSIQAIREIKQFADAALYDDAERYNRDYSDAGRRAERAASDTAETDAATV